MEGPFSPFADGAEHLLCQPGLMIGLQELE